jgi:K+-sensing histidine kinase KdpD
MSYITESWNDNVVPPDWLPRDWRHGWVLFVLSGGIQVAATLLTAMVLALIPDFSFRGALFIIGATLSSHFFGGTLGLFSSALGTLLLKFFFLAPTFSLLLDKLSDIWVSLFYFGVCLVVAYFARPKGDLAAH